MLTLNVFLSSLEKSKIPFKQIESRGLRTIEIRSKGGKLLKYLFNDTYSDKFIKSATIETPLISTQKKFVRIQSNDPNALSHRIDVTKSQAGEIISEKSILFWKNVDGKQPTATLDFTKGQKSETMPKFLNAVA